MQRDNVDFVTLFPNTLVFTTDAPDVEILRIITDAFGSHKNPLLRMGPSSAVETALVLLRAFLTRGSSAHHTSRTLFLVELVTLSRSAFTGPLKLLTPVGLR